MTEERRQEAPRRASFGLALRLGLLGMLAAVLVAGVGGWILRNIVHDTVIRSFMQGLEARAERIESRLSILPGGGITEERSRAADVFDQIFSGWYWQLRQSGSGSTILRSRSQWDAASLQGQLASSGVLKAEGPQGEALLGLTRAVQLGEQTLTLEVYGPQEPVAHDLLRFDHSLALVVLSLMLSWMAATWLQVRLGLRPLRRLRQRVTTVELEGGTVGRGYGADLDPLAGELDEMLLRNSRLVMRARSHAADLSHALKKPLTLLAAESSGTANVSSARVRLLVDSMSSLIDRHLARAASAAAAEGMQARLDVASVLHPLLQLLQTLHQHRALHWHSELSASLSWRGDRTDLEEMLGNLIDNAGKWARSEIQVRAWRESAQDGRPAALVITVDDDGPGLDDEQIGRAARRGQRFDEATEGSGLGLAIVADIATTYAGTLQLDRSPTLGGLRAHLRLPA